MVEKVPHHIQMLLTEYAKRKKNNPRYSLRAFAKFLGMSSPTLSRVLSNSQELSITACKKIIKKLNFNDHQSLVFVRSIAEQKCSRTYNLLSIYPSENKFYPHERNLLFISDIQHKCIFINDEASRILERCEHESMPKVFNNLGFKKDVSEFAHERIKSVMKNGETCRHHLPLDTSVGKLAIETHFSPLLGNDGQISAVASVLNINLDLVRT